MSSIILFSRSTHLSIAKSEIKCAKRVGYFRNIVFDLINQKSCSLELDAFRSLMSGLFGGAQTKAKGCKERAKKDGCPRAS